MIFAQGPQLWLTTHQPLQQLLLCRAQVAPDEQVAMLEQLGHALLEALDPPRLSFVLLAWSATSLLGDLGLHLLAEFGQRSQHRQRISLRTWNPQSWCGVVGHNSLSTLG